MFAIYVKKQYGELEESEWKSMNINQNLLRK